MGVNKYTSDGGGGGTSGGGGGHHAPEVEVRKIDNSAVLATQRERIQVWRGG